MSYDAFAIDVITPAVSQDLISLDEAKILLGISTSDTTSDAQLNLLIDMTSDDIANLCNRVFGKETVVETWACLLAILCPDDAMRIWLSHYPVESIDSVESPAGTVLDPSAWWLAKASGALTVYNATSEIVVTYTGGYDLPDEAPPTLKKATGLLIRDFRMQAAISSTSGSGVRMIAHKESRIMYFSPKDMVQTTQQAITGKAQTASALDAVLSPFTRYFI
jgi:hypothetical protein